jgi:hypothetical protein
VTTAVDLVSVIIKGCCCTSAVAVPLLPQEQRAPHWVLLCCRQLGQQQTVHTACLAGAQGQHRKEAGGTAKDVPCLSLCRATSACNAIAEVKPGQMLLLPFPSITLSAEPLHKLQPNTDLSTKILQPGRLILSNINRCFQT